MQSTSTSTSISSAEKTLSKGKCSETREEVFKLQPSLAWNHLNVSTTFRHEAPEDIFGSKISFVITTGSGPLQKPEGEPNPQCAQQASHKRLRRGSVAVRVPPRATPRCTPRAAKPITKEIPHKTTRTRGRPRGHPAGPGGGTLSRPQG